MNLKDYQVVVLGLLIAAGTVLSTVILSKAVVEFQKLQNQKYYRMELENLTDCAMLLHDTQQN